MTLEEAQAMIVELKAQIKDGSERYNSLTLKHEELSKTLESQNEHIAKLKEANMRYFEMITAHEPIQQQPNAQQEETAAEPAFIDWSELD